jgi:uridylate kinase
LRKAVLKLTGKLFRKEHARKLDEIVGYITEFVEAGGRLAVVTGGGQLARDYIELGAEAGLRSRSWQDVIGVAASRLNALLFASLLDEHAYLPIPESVEDFLQAWSSGKVVIMGGLQPGQSTNAVAAAIAELIAADVLINASVVEGVYDKDPNRFADARLLKRVKVEELRKYLQQSFMPGRYELLDPVALGIIERSRLRVVFLNALKPAKIGSALKGDFSVGTLVE